MNAKFKFLAGSLVGAIAIHAAFVACGGPGHEGAGLHDGGILDGMLDAIASAIDGTTRDAQADTDGGGASSCCSAPVQSVPASENPAQLVRGNTMVTATSSAGVMTLVLTGPFVLTDAAIAATYTSNVDLYVEAAASACPAPSATTVADYLGRVSYVNSYPAGSTNSTALVAESIHGGRYIVPAGKMLCAVQNGIPGAVQWAGFRPY
jgi:hypothetical protein